MRIRRLLLWWVLTLTTILAYAGVDAWLHPDEVKVTVDQLTIRWNPEEPFAFIHAGARLVGAVGWPGLALQAAFLAGLLVTIASLFVREE